MTENYNVKPEQAKVLEDLEKLVGKAIPQLEEIKWRTIGVIVEGDNVIGLGLYNQGLKTLSESIGNLTYLQTLELESNMISTLPESITKLKILQRLYLSRNKLTTLPESIGNLSSLQKLHLSGNQLMTLPESIGDLKFLKKLVLYRNKLSTLPESIGNLSSLIELSLGRNQLSTLPESIGNLSSLKELSLHDNKLRTLPESISRLNSLKELNLYGNELTTLPESITKLKSLQKLHFGRNQLTTLPKSFSQLKNLKEIDLKKNNWKGEWQEMVTNDIPTILKLCRKLHGFDIFISHAMKDEKQYRVVELKNYLENEVIIQEQDNELNIIHEVYICEEDVVDDIQEFMAENVPKSQLLLFVATSNSFASEACRYELSLARKHGIEILPIKGNDIIWEDLKHIDLSEYEQEDLELNTPKEKFEFNGKNFDDICLKLSEYMKTHESELKKSKKEMEVLEHTKKDITDVINSIEFKDMINSNLKDFDKIFQELSNNQISNFAGFLKLGELLNKKK